jgi:predicted Zn-ribbon and HTH transcriptional regulator
MTEPQAPAHRRATLRQALAEALRREQLSAHELSGLVGLPEKEVAGHLAHLAKSLPAHGERLTVTPPACLACGFAFAERRRLTRPSRCPQCHATHLAEPRFGIALSKKP